MGFQSRLDQRWVKPFSDEIVRGLPAKGVKRLLVASPAFVADCGGGEERFWFVCWAFHEPTWIIAQGL